MMKDFKIKSINNKTFFVENNPKNGIITKVSFTEHLSKLSKFEKRKLEKLFSDLQNGVPIQLSPFDYTTEEDQITFVYVNLRFVNGGGTSYTVICFDGFDKFRALLATHKIEVDLEGLIAEASADEENNDFEIIKNNAKAIKNQKESETQL
ncbi:hypothetical protein [Sphingobacterium athyrii]|nr:hypothetical protein [Sphingobacterium athyrii]